jgi:hypothetical protein
MTFPVQAFRRQGQAHKTNRSNSGAAYFGAFTSELFAFGTITGAVIDGALITGVTDKKIRVLSYAVSAQTASSITFNTKPTGAGTAIMPTIYLAANGNSNEADNNGLFETSSGEGLTATTGTNTVGVRLTYILVD